MSHSSIEIGQNSQWSYSSNELSYPNVLGIQDGF
jgi:hypothetical protein